MQKQNHLGRGKNNAVPLHEQYSSKFTHFKCPILTQAYRILQGVYCTQYFYGPLRNDHNAK